MAVTLRDVAAHAGVSIRTVSNVVRGYEHVSPLTRSKVLHSIEELGYRANPVAQTLRTGRTRVLLLAVPEIDVPYFSELAKEVIRQAASHGYSITITQTNDADPGAALHPTTRSVLFDGILYASRIEPHPTPPTPPGSATPVVLLGEGSFDGRHDHVAIDNVRAAHDAVTHLSRLGRRWIGAIGPQPGAGFSTPAQRLEGYHQALLDTGLPYDPTLTVPAAHYSREEGYDAARTLLSQQERPDALFCFSDLLAIGALRAARDLGVRVPDDLAVMGVDDIPEGRFSSPSLTTIALDIPFIALEAVRRLTARIEDPDLPAEEVVAPHRLIVRESCGGTLAASAAT